MAASTAFDPADFDGADSTELFQRARETMRAARAAPRAAALARAAELTPAARELVVAEWHQHKLEQLSAELREAQGVILAALRARRAPQTPRGGAPQTPRGAPQTPRPLAPPELVEVTLDGRTRESWMRGRALVGSLLKRKATGECTVELLVRGRGCSAAQRVCVTVPAAHVRDAGAGAAATESSDAAQRPPPGSRVLARARVAARSGSVRGVVKGYGASASLGDLVSLEVGAAVLHFSRQALSFERVLGAEEPLEPLDPERRVRALVKSARLPGEERGWSCVTVLPVGRGALGPLLQLPFADGEERLEVKDGCFYPVEGGATDNPAELRRWLRSDRPAQGQSVVLDLFFPGARGGPTTRVEAVQGRVALVEEAHFRLELATPLGGGCVLRVQDRPFAFAPRAPAEGRARSARELVRELGEFLLPRGKRQLLCAGTRVRFAAAGRGEDEQAQLRELAAMGAVHGVVARDAEAGAEEVALTFAYPHGRTRRASAPRAWLGRVLLLDLTDGENRLPLPREGCAVEVLAGAMAGRHGRVLRQDGDTCTVRLEAQEDGDLSEQELPTSTLWLTHPQAPGGDEEAAELSRRGLLTSRKRPRIA